MKKYKVNQRCLTFVSPTQARKMAKVSELEPFVLWVWTKEFWIRIDLPKETYAVGAYEG